MLLFFFFSAVPKYITIPFSPLTQAVQKPVPWEFLQKPEYWAHFSLFISFSGRSWELYLGHITFCMYGALEKKCHELFWILWCSSSWLCAHLGLLKPLTWYQKVSKIQIGLYMIVKLMFPWGKRPECFYLSDITPQLIETFDSIASTMPHTQQNITLYTKILKMRQIIRREDRL